MGSDTVYRGAFFDLVRESVELPNGRRTQLEILRHPGASAVAPFLDDERLLLIRQYRHATRDTIWEVPAGKLDPGEAPGACAHRELEEETGYRAARIQSLGAIWTTPGFTDERIHLFAAFDLEHVGARPDADEVIEPVEVSLASALELVFSGELCDAKSALAILYAARAAGRLR